VIDHRDCGDYRKFGLLTNTTMNRQSEDGSLPTHKTAQDFVKNGVSTLEIARHPSPD
jgi:hypothetical protein